jgi:hypothetical protein
MALSYKIVFHKVVMDMSNGARWPCRFWALIPGSISRRIDSMATKIAAFWHCLILVLLLLTGHESVPKSVLACPISFLRTSLDDCEMSYSSPRIQRRTWAGKGTDGHTSTLAGFSTNNEQLHEGSSRPARLATANI